MKKILLPTLFLLFPAQAWAAGCDCGSINGMITMAKMETIQTVKEALIYSGLFPPQSPVLR